MRWAGRLGRFAARVVPIRRGVLEAQLAMAFPEMPNAERRQAIERIYVNLAALALELLALSRVDPPGLESLIETRLEEVPEMKALLDSGTGFVLLSAHMGNWEWAGARLAGFGRDVAYAAKPMHDAVAERFITEIRSRFGLKPVSTRESPRRVMSHLIKVLRGGGIVAIPADQDARNAGIFVDFFGHAASTFTGPAWMACKLGVPILPMFTVRTPEGRLRCLWEPPIWPNAEAEEEAEIRRLTECHVRALERAIRLDPSQYLWFHRRWKTRPKEEGPPGA